jgi:glutamine synthetase
VVRESLPPPLYDAFAAAKTDEWERFCGTVTEWHREMYMQAIP